MSKGSSKLAAAILATSILGGASVAYHPDITRNGKQFDIGSIMKARKNNRRNKNQKRLRGMGFK